MSFQKWVQDSFFQDNFVSPIVQGIKLIFRNPNNRPFKKSTVDMTFKSSRIKMDLKNDEIEQRLLIP